MTTRVLDVFVTRDSYDYDDAYVFGAQSVLEPVTSASGVRTGTVTDSSDEEYGSVWFRYAAGPSNELNVGDIIRIGLPAFGGHTNYVTILEVYKGTTITAYRMDTAVPIFPKTQGTVLHNGTTYHAIPIFRVKQWSTSMQQCRLDTGVKHVKWVKLVGYSVFDKRHTRHSHGHEAIADDWVAMHIDEIRGDVVSNNPAAHASFAVLHMGTDQNSQSGARQFYQYDAQGVATHTFEQPTALRNLNFRFLDRTGEPAHFGRIHMWFKMCVTHG
jgi:hypothetical protein